MTTTQLATARHHRLGLTALEALLHLAATDGLPMSTLAGRVGISTAAITGTADGLAKKGLVCRVASSADRRSISLGLTELGRVRVYQLTGRQPQPSAARHDCGSGHDYGICPDCGRGHGFALLSKPAPANSSH